MLMESQAVCKDPRTVAAGGGSELEVARQLAEHGRKETGLEQYAYAKFAEALEVRNSPAILCILAVCIQDAARMHGPSCTIQHMG